MRSGRRRVCDFLLIEQCIYQYTDLWAKNTYTPLLCALMLIGVTQSSIRAKNQNSGFTSLSLPGSPFTVRRGSRGSHQFTWRTANSRRFGDKKPLVLSTYSDAQEHLPYADDSAAVTPMSEENGAIIVPVYTNLGSRHNSYTSHTSRVSYTSHGDLLNGKPPQTKESQLRSRTRKNLPELERSKVLQLVSKRRDAEGGTKGDDEVIDSLIREIFGPDVNLEYIDKDSYFYKQLFVRFLGNIYRCRHSYILSGMIFITQKNIPVAKASLQLKKFHSHFMIKCQEYKSLIIFLIVNAKESSAETEEILALKMKNPETNPFIDPIQKHTVVDMRDVMVLNDIIEQAAAQAGRQSRQSDRGGKFYDFCKICVHMSHPDTRKPCGYKIDDLIVVTDDCYISSSKNSSKY
ncbi:hypothetical protein Avbf_06028 [Armadillidium vulgare]|nr:hypothetical protein Avbf_06028 [Armadillidium vulgare]